MRPVPHTRQVLSRSTLTPRWGFSLLRLTPSPRSSVLAVAAPLSVTRAAFRSQHHGSIRSKHSVTNIMERACGKRQMDSGSWSERVRADERAMKRRAAARKGLLTEPTRGSCRHRETISCSHQHSAVHVSQAGSDPRHRLDQSACRVAVMHAVHHPTPVSDAAGWRVTRSEKCARHR